MSKTDRWCEKGCGKRVRFHELVIWKHPCYEHNKRTTIYRCTECGQMYINQDTRQDGGVKRELRKKTKKWYRELINKSIYAGL